MKIGKICENLATPENGGDPRKIYLLDFIRKIDITFSKRAKNNAKKEPKKEVLANRA